MSDTVSRLQEPPSVMVTSRRTDWAAIWAGVFTFAAVWSVFEALGVAIFPGAGVSLGLAIWTVVLTVIAMYVAGLETGRLGAVASRQDGLVHGMIMFGLSVVSVVILTSVVNGLMYLGSAGRVGYNMMLGSGEQWAEFVALFLGWLAAMGGASSGIAGRGMPSRPAINPPVSMRPAA